MFDNDYPQDPSPLSHDGDTATPPPNSSESADARIGTYEVTTDHHEDITQVSTLTDSSNPSQEQCEELPAPADVNPEQDDDAARSRQALLRLRQEIGKAIVGQDGAVTGLIIALVAGGHALLEGVPGVAKTLLVRSMAASLDMEMTRVQFTPDLMPSDITGSLVWDAGTSTFAFRPGPVFTHLFLADEINRTPPKTQSALLEAMEEHQVTIDGVRHPLSDPFMVIATENPIEHEGTYPLPEAQLDRFLLKIELPLLNREDELEVLNRHERGFNPLDLGEAGIRSVATVEDIHAARDAVKRTVADSSILAYIVDIIQATRRSPSLRLGVSPRGATALLHTSRVWAYLMGRTFVIPDDVKAMAPATLTHRVSTRPEADLEGITAETVIRQVLSSVPVPR